MSLDTDIYTDHPDDETECTCDLEMDNLHYADCPKLQALLNEEEHGNPQ